MVRRERASNWCLGEVQVASGVGARLIRTFRRSLVGPYASSIQPRLDIAASPYPAPGMLGIALDRSVLALGILRPV
jgi:hypothetical protein